MTSLHSALRWFRLALALAAGAYLVGLFLGFGLTSAGVHVVYLVAQ